MLQAFKNMGYIKEEREGYGNLENVKMENTFRLMKDVLDNKNKLTIEKSQFLRGDTKIQQSFQLLQDYSESLKFDPPVRKPKKELQQLGLSIGDLFVNRNEVISPQEQINVFKDRQNKLLEYKRMNVDNRLESLNILEENINSMKMQGITIPENFRQQIENKDLAIQHIQDENNLIEEELKNLNSAIMRAKQQTVKKLPVEEQFDPDYMTF